MKKLIKEINWTCYPVHRSYANKLEDFENDKIPIITDEGIKLLKNEIVLPIGEEKKYASDAIPNPNVPEQFVFPAYLMNKLKVYKAAMFGSPLKSETFNIGKNTFRFADLGEYDSASSYTIGNIVSFGVVDETTKLKNMKRFVNLVVIPGKKLNNPITDIYAWAPFKYADSN